MKTHKLFGFAAIVAVIALSMTALSLTGCPTTDNGGNLKTLSGSITISGNSGETVTTGTKLTADYDGDEEVTYQWNKNGTAIEGATGNEYTPDEAGSYTVTVSATGYTSKTSDPITVTGESLQDLSGEVTVTPNTDVTTGMKLTAAYSGNEAVTYQWNKNGTAIANATGNEYTPSEAGSYTVTVKADGYKEKTSDAVTVISAFTAAPELTLEPGNGKITYTWTESDPAADSYDVYYIQGDNKTAAEVKASTTKIIGATSGGEITGLTNGTTYCVIVSANKAEYPSIDSGVETATPAMVYRITGSGTEFTATKNGATFGTANQPIQDVINAIRGDASGTVCIIHFGDGNTALDIGSSSVSFANDGTNTWGLVELGGKITSSVSSTTSGTIAIADTVSVTSTADIANTATGTDGRAIYNNSTGTLTICDGTVSATTSRAVHNASTGAVNISGGTVSTTSSPAVYNASTGAVNISGGTVSATTSSAVYNASTGKITVSGTETIITSENISGSSGTIFIANNGSGGDRLIIEGGTVKNTASNAAARAIYNNSTGALTISGGTVSATTGYAVYNYSTGKITVSGTETMITSESTNGTIYLYAESPLEITGGTVENTSTTTTSAIRNNYNGTVIISGGTVSAKTGYAVYSTGNNAVVTISGGTVSATTGCAVYNNQAGKITVSGTAKVTSANTDAAQGTIFIASSGTAIVARLVIEGGTVENTSTTTGNAIYNASTGAVNIIGGTVSKAGTTGNAIYNNSTGVVTIDPAATIVGTNYGVTP
jgi:hypothetical protein